METQGKKRAVYTFIHITLTALAAVAVELFLLLSLSFFRAEWGNSLWLFLVIGGSVLNAVILATDVFAYFKGKELIYKACSVHRLQHLWKRKTENRGWGRCSVPAAGLR